MDRLSRSLDNFIDVAINRLGCENAVMSSDFILDLKDVFPDRQRITSTLIDETVKFCQFRGMSVFVNGHLLKVTVDLRHCLLNPEQSVKFNTAFEYTQRIHGNFL